jgi:hypothetical protein
MTFESGSLTGVLTRARKKVTAASLIGEATNRDRWRRRGGAFVIRARKRRPPEQSIARH